MPSLNFNGYNTPIWSWRLLDLRGLSVRTVGLLELELELELELDLDLELQLQLELEVELVQV